MSYTGFGSLGYGQPGPYASGYSYPVGTAGAGAWGSTNWGAASAPVMASRSSSASLGAWGSAIGAVGDYFNSRAEAKAAEAGQKRNLAAERYFADMKRQDALEDKRFLEESAGVYRQLARPNLKREPAPVMTDPNTIRPVNPYGRG